MGGRRRQLLAQSRLAALLELLRARAVMAERPDMVVYLLAVELMDLRQVIPALLEF
jgi:hypothetical protein